MEDLTVSSTLGGQQDADVLAGLWTLLLAPSCVVRGHKMTLQVVFQVVGRVRGPESGLLKSRLAGTVVLFALIVAMSFAVPFVWIRIGGVPYGLPPSTPKLFPSTPAEISVDLGGGVKLVMTYAEAGKFLMGSNIGDKDEKPVHEVDITKGFYIGKYEVTQAQFERVMGNNPSHFVGADRPVEDISWDDAMEFCRKMAQSTGRKVRLPTEAEWEYACRAGSAGAYCYGDDEEKLGDYAWYYQNSGDQTHPVGHKKPNAWGLYDMHGNVLEWCSDWYGEDYYKNSPRTDPQGPTGGIHRSLRGGSWFLNSNSCRSGFRSWYDVSYGRYSFGFRVVSPE